MRKIIGLILLLVILMGASCSKKLASEAPQESELEQIEPDADPEITYIDADPPPFAPDPEPPSDEEDEIFDIVEWNPAYPGGEEAMRKFIKDNLNYPDSAVKQGLQGKVIVKFVVEKDSSVSNVTVYRTFDKSCGEEAARVVKLMKWIPGRQRNKVVRVWQVVPFTFKLN